MNIFEPDDAYDTGTRDSTLGAPPEAPRPEVIDRRAMRRDSAVRNAYQRGRRDERARRRGSPLGAAILWLAACAGVFVVGLAIHEGSFARSGQVIDQNIATASTSASQATRHAASKAGDAIEGAGGRLKQTAAGRR